MHIKSPQMFPAFPPVWALDRIRNTAPAQPMSTPPAFIHVIGSLRMSNDRIIANIGIDVVTMLEFIGEVKLNPNVKRH